MRLKKRKPKTSARRASARKPAARRRRHRSGSKAETAALSRKYFGAAA